VLDGVQIPTRRDNFEEGWAGGNPSKFEKCMESFMCGSDAAFYQINDHLLLLLSRIVIIHCVPKSKTTKVMAVYI